MNILNKLRKPKKHVLVVDDEQNISMAMAYVLRNAGFETAEAGSCAEALTRMTERPADAVLLDIELPDSNGLEFLIKFKSLYPNVPVVMMTGLGYEENLMETAQKNGASGYVTKGVGMDDAIVAIKRVLPCEHEK